VDERGTIIGGKYVLVEVVGSGGMATVWRAVAQGEQPEAQVAIKRVKENVAHELNFIELFVEEARVCTTLLHPNIVRIFDFGEDESGRYYLVMEWVDGVSFAQYLQTFFELSTLPPWHLVAAIAAEALQGLNAAHERVDTQGHIAPVYHRDVTPQNILLGRNGAVKITDFGLARAMDRSRMTAPNVIKGKVGYLAPEMTEAKQPTAQTDIYSLGVAMWQALAGRRLFDGKDNIEIFVAAKKGEVPPLTELRPDVSARFSGIVDRALAFDPSDRFTTAAQMARVVTNMLHAEGMVPDRAELARSVNEVCVYRQTGKLPGS
jgi:serine/threonine protein kinase